MKRPKRLPKQIGKASRMRKAADSLIAMPAIVSLEGSLVRAFARIEELEHDIRAFALLVAEHLGEPFRTGAKEITDKFQTGVKK